MIKRLLTSFLLVLPMLTLAWKPAEERINIKSITPSEQTGQDYSPWLNDDLNKLVADAWQGNLKYTDVTLNLEKTCQLTRLSLYDYQSIFTDQPATIYAVNGSQKTLIGKFDGSAYMQWVDLVTATPITANAILIHKYGNNIPQKIKVFGVAIAQTEESIKRVSATPSEQTGQDYSPWLNDDMNKLIADAWQNNLKYIDVTIKLEKKCQLTRLSLYDYQGIFTDKPATIYALNGDQKVLLGTFDGSAYLQWVDIKPTASTIAEAILIHKYGNNIPQKVKVFGFPIDSPSTPVTPIPPVEVTPPVTVPDPPKIVIDAKRWYQVNNVSNGLDGLFDGKTDQPVNTGWSKMLANYDAYYPLLEGEKMSIERIRFYDGQGQNTDAPMTLSIITDDWKRIPIARFIGDKYNAWVGPDPQKPTEFALKTPVTNARYLVLNTSGAYPNEMELYGSCQAGKSPKPLTARSVPFSQYVGVNAFEWNVEDANSPWQVDETRIPPLKTFSAVRHYLDWQKLEPQPGQYTFNPTQDGSWNYDAMYQRLKAEGIQVLVCLKTIPQWLENTYPSGQRDYENVPAPYGRDLAAPQSYIEQARVGFQLAARYGSNKSVNPSLVKVSTATTWAGTNSVKIGLGLIRYIECDNERDKTWKGRQAYQTAREYAANLSAFYDGHKNTMGQGVGVKNADPNIQVVIGGLAASTTDYVRAMIDWCKEFRGYKANGEVDLCWDVINQHLYANNAQSSQGGGSSRGAAPEVSGVGDQAKAFVKMAHEWGKDQPVWITEAGYDVNQGSPFKAIAIGSKSVLETQADWTLRTALLYSRVGIDRLFFYQLTDDNVNNPIQFSSMGLINDNKTRKPAADYLYQANQLLGAYSYKETINADPLVDRYEFNNRSAYVLLIPDEKGRTGTYDLNVGNAASVQVYTPKAGSKDMTVATLVSSNGKVTVKVSETPVFVIPSSGTGRVGADLVNDVYEGLGTLQVYPNPATDYINLELQNSNTNHLEVKIYDGSLGRLHKQVSLPKTDDKLRERIDLKSLPYGLYMMEIQQGYERVVKKIIKVQ